MGKLVVIALILTTLFNSCRKESLSSNCQRLKDGIISEDLREVETAIANYISGLPNKGYTMSNVNKLCQRISSDCDVSVSLLCFDCIQTLPPQTEIRISFESDGTAKAMTIDLTYNAANEIIFRNMHD